MTLQTPSHRSLDDVHRSVVIPSGGRWWRRMLAFAGPAYMVSVGYMDPGNWATDIEGGARFGYQLIWVLLMSNLMAILLQTLSARLGVVTGRDLAQACRDAYAPPVRWVLFVLCEIAIAACDLAEVLGTAIGLNLLFGIPLLWAVLITGVDVLLLLAIQRLGIRKMEAFIILLISTIGLCFILELFLSKPSPAGIVAGFVPSALSGDALYVAMGMLGATVMPHNLYLHSALAQSRDVARTQAGVAQACRFNLIDSAVALNAAFFVNAAILIVAAATFHRHGIHVTEIQQAHHLLDDVLGSSLAAIAFALALLCAGQSSTLTGTLAGQITMEGFLRLRMRPWLRRMITRSVALVPAVVVISLMGDAGTYRLLILSQVILSLQLPFAVVPLIKFTGSRRHMGDFKNARWVRVLAWAAAGVIIGLNVMLVYGRLAQWIEAAGPYRWLVALVAVPVATGLAGLLLYLVFRRESREIPAPAVSAQTVADAAVLAAQKFHRVGVALGATPADTPMLAEAIALAKAHGAELVLMHIVEGVGGQWYGSRANDYERRQDEQYITELADHLRVELKTQGVPDVRPLLGYGSVTQGLVRLVREAGIDMLVIGGHGHKGLADLWRGETIQGVRHGLSIPVLAVRESAAEPDSKPN